MKKGLCPLCRLLLFFLFRIILLFLLIRLLNQIRNIDCKDWEHHHSQSCQQYGEYPSGSRHRDIFDPTVVTSINAHHKASP